MAMTMNGQVQLAASREVVWAKLNDPEVLKSCIPGSEQLDKISDNEFQAIATVKVGPVKARWKGKVRLSDLDPPNSYRISGEGEGGVAGFAKGGAKRRQARPARTAPYQQRGEEDCRRFLRQVRRGGDATGMTPPASAQVGSAQVRSAQVGSAQVAIAA